MCGAVTFTVANPPASFGACHCETCRRWTGSALMGFNVTESDITWKGEAHIKTLQSSDWAERAWCQRCGTGLYYHVTADGPMSDNLELPIGLLDDPSGLKMTSEIYVDHRIDSVAFAGEREQLTRSEVLKKFGIPEDSM